MSREVTCFGPHLPLLFSVPRAPKSSHGNLAAINKKPIIPLAYMRSFFFPSHVGLSGLVCSGTQALPARPFLMAQGSTPVPDNREKWRKIAAKVHIPAASYRRVPEPVTRYFCVYHIDQNVIIS